MNGSLRALAPTHPGALLLHIGELEFSTDIVGESPDFSFHLSIPSLSLLAIDAIPDPAIENSKTSSGVSYWKVRPMVGQVPLELMDVCRELVMLCSLKYLI